MSFSRMPQPVSPLFPVAGPKRRPAATPRQRVRRRLVLTCAVLAAATATGFLVRHQQPPPDAAAGADWSAVCHGHGGSDVHRLLGGGPSVAEFWSTDHFAIYDSPSDVDATQVCAVYVGEHAFSITAERIHPRAVPNLESLIASTARGREHFRAGDGGRAGSTDATALVTCRAPGVPPFRAEIRTELHGAPAHNPDRRHLMENIVRDWATDLEHTKNCGWPPDPTSANHTRKDTT